MLALESNPRHESIAAQAKLLIYLATLHSVAVVLVSNGTVITGEEGNRDVLLRRFGTLPQIQMQLFQKLTAYLVADGYRVDLQLSAANNWEHTFTGLPDNVTLT